MRAWWRAEMRRDEVSEAQTGLFDLVFADASGPWARPAGLRTGPAGLAGGVTGGGAVAAPAAAQVEARPSPWAGAWGLLSGAPPSALRAIAACNARTIFRGFACGASVPHVEGACGHAGCPRCAGAAAAEAGAAARAAWPERVLVARFGLRAPGGATLPGPQAVLAVRTAWGGIAAAAGGLEAFPLVVVDPDGVTVFARVPDGDGAGPCAAVVAAARKATLRDVTAEVTPRAAAAATLEAALTLEARRLEEVVTRGVAAGDLAEAAGLVAARDPKRATVAASRQGLPCDAARRVRAAARTCPTHGAGCAAVASIVREGEREVACGAPLADAPTRQVVGPLLGA